MLGPLMMEEASWQKLAIMEFFIQHEPELYSVNTLTSELELSYSTGSTLVQEIDYDLQDLFGYHFLTREGKINWQPILYRHNEYIQYLLRASVSYNFVLYSLIEPQLNLEDFCERLHLSQSTALRKLRPLKDYLKKFKIKLLASRMQLMGAESMIRIFYITYLWAGNHGRDIRLSAYDFALEDELMKRLDLDEAEFMHPQEIFLRLAVNRLRVMQGHQLDEPNLIPPSNSSYYYTVKRYYEKFIPECKQVKLHTKFVGYMLNYSPYYLQTEDFRIRMLENDFSSLQITHPDLIELVEEFEDFFFKELTNTENNDYEETYLLHINAFITLVNYTMYACKLPLIKDITEYVHNYDLKLFQQLEKNIDVFFKRMSRRKKFTWLGECLHELVEDMTFASFPTYKDSFNHQYLNVGLLAIPDYFVMQSIKALLNQFSFVHIVYHDFTDESVDFIVTTFETLLPKHLEKPYYVVELVKNIDCQEELFTKLWTTYKNKVAPKIISEQAKRYCNRQEFQKIIEWRN